MAVGSDLSLVGFFQAVVFGIALGFGFTIGTALCGFIGALMARERPKAAVILLPFLLAGLAATQGCTQRNCTYGWDPATMRCAKWCNGAIVQSMVGDDHCAGMEKPKETADK